MRRTVAAWIAIACVATVVAGYSFRFLGVFAAGVAAFLVLQRVVWSRRTIRIVFAVSAIVFVLGFVFFMAVFLEEEPPWLARPLHYSARVWQPLTALTGVLAGAILTFAFTALGFTRRALLLGVPIFATGLLLSYGLLANLFAGEMANGRAGAFSVAHTAAVSFDGKVFTIDERYEIIPDQGIVVVGVTEFVPAPPPGVSVARKPTVDHEGQMTEYLLVTVKRHQSAVSERAGLLRRRVSFQALQDWRVWLRFPDGSESGAPGASGVFGEGSPVHDHIASSKITLTMPKNSFIASIPTGLIIPATDRDVVYVDFDFTRIHRIVNIEYLTALRIAKVVEMFGTASRSDIILMVAFFVGWPAIVIAGGVLNQRVGQAIAGVVAPRRTKQRRAGFVQ